MAPVPTGQLVFNASRLQWNRLGPHTPACCMLFVLRTCRTRQCMPTHTVVAIHCARHLSAAHGYTTPGTRSLSFTPCWLTFCCGCNINIACGRLHSSAWDGDVAGAAFVCPCFPTCGYLDSTCSPYSSTVPTQPCTGPTLLLCCDKTDQHHILYYLLVSV